MPSLCGEHQFKKAEENQKSRCPSQSQMDWEADSSEAEEIRFNAGTVSRKTRCGRHDRAIHRAIPRFAQYSNVNRSLRRSQFGY